MCRIASLPTEFRWRTKADQFGGGQGTLAIDAAKGHAGSFGQHGLCLWANPWGVVYEVNHPRGNFANAYEESKWEAEEVWAHQATIIRPGVIVGDSQTGRCTSFTGWYIIAKGGYLMDQFLNFAPAHDRQDLQIEVPMDPKATLNLVPVDYVAKATIQLIENPVNHNQIFHLTHPHPLTHEWSHDVMCRRFNLGGIRFTGFGASLSESNDPLKLMIWNQTRKMYSYFSSNPTFDRTNADRVGTSPG